MPTISVNRKDFDKLLGRHATDKELEAWLPLVKGEIKEVDAASGEIRFELQDSNRPDLWCVEGIARQIRIKLKDRKSTRLNSSHSQISYAVFCLKKKKSCRAGHSRTRYS